jgi:hypothetical protein
MKIKPQRHGDTENPMIETFKDKNRFTKEFISKAIPPHPYPLPPGERGSIISPPLTGGD